MLEKILNLMAFIGGVLAFMEYLFYLIRKAILDNLD